MYANHRHYILFTLAFITFVVTTLGFSFLRDRVYRQAVHSADLLKNVSEIESKQKREHDVTSAYSKLTDEQKLVSSYVLSEEKAVDFIEAVEEIGRESSTTLSISNIETNPIVKTNKISDNFTRMGAQVEAEGTWTNISRALILLENMPYSVSLNNVRLYVDAAPEPVIVGTTTKSVKERTWKLSANLKILAL